METVLSKYGGRSYKFGPFQFEPAEHRLLRDGVPVPLPPKVLDTLLVLIEHNGRVVRKEELIAAVWPDSFVDDNSLTQNISLLRKALAAGVGREPQAVGRALGVEAVLDGTIQRSGETVRVTVKLINVRDGRALWAENFDERFTDIFSLQDSVSQRVADALALRVSPEEQQLLAQHSTEDTEAFQLYTTGLFFWNQRTEEGLTRAADYFQRAVDRDPLYARAYAGLADSHSLMAYYGYGHATSDEAFARADLLAQKALALDATLAEAYTTLALIRVEHEGDFGKAEPLYRRAIELNPNYSTAHVRYGWLLLFKGELENAQREAGRAQELDPVSPFTNVALGQMLYFQRDYDGAIRYSLRGLELGPSQFAAHKTLSLAYEQKGLYKEALAEIEKGRGAESSASSEALETLGHIYAAAGQRAQALKALSDLRRIVVSKPGVVGFVGLAIIHESLGQREQALDWAAKALALRTELPLRYRFDARLDALRQDPRFKKLQEVSRARG
ncbi:MAG TPA: tetratricopeptide repeat protein [Pyrinomonadaceae bacterium]|nr:tetratricopeptide repeat protein [Pyrinomonadaceae bacterium]